MAAPDKTYQSNDVFTMTITAAAGTVTMDLPALLSAQMGWVIDRILIYALGTLTALDVKVTESGGSTIAWVGGQVVAATMIPIQPIEGPIVGLRNNQLKVVLTATGANPVQLTVIARQRPCA